MPTDTLIDPIDALQASENIDVFEVGQVPDSAEIGGSRVLKAILVAGKVSEPPGSSGQLPPEDGGSHFQGLDVVDPPYNPGLWALVPEQNTRLGRAINTWARNTVGLGWRIIAQDPEGNAVDKEELEAQPGLKEKFESERRQLQALFMFPNREMPFTRVLFDVKRDEEATGNGYLEVVRNAVGVITGLYHIPSHTMRVRKKGLGFVQLRGLNASPTTVTFSVSEGGTPQRRYFKNFGDPRVIHRITGKPSNGRLGVKKRATEIIHFKVSTARSQLYGAPRYVSTAPATTGNRLAAERNVNFFDNDAVPRGIIFVTGGKLDTRSVGRIEKFIRAKSQGVENSGRLLVLQLESKRTAMGEEGSAAMHFQPLTVGVTEDASFLSYRAANDEEIREAFGLAESFFRTDTVNRASAEIGRQTTNEQEFEPDRLEKEFLLNHTIASDPNWEGGPMSVARLQFRRPQIADPSEKARINTLYAGAGGLTPNDLRRELGKDPYPDEFTFADKPLPWALAELKAQVVGLNGIPAPIPVPETPGEAGGGGDEGAKSAAEQQRRAAAFLAEMGDPLDHFFRMVEGVRQEVVADDQDGRLDSLLKEVRDDLTSLRTLTRKSMDTGRSPGRRNNGSGFRY